QVTVAGMEPDRLSQLSHCLQALEGITLNAPTAFLAQQTGQRVSDGVQVGRNIQAPPEQVISGVHDDAQLFRRNHLAKTVDQLRTAGASRKHGDHPALRAKPSSSTATLSY